AAGLSVFASSGAVPCEGGVSVVREMCSAPFGVSLPSGLFSGPMLSLRMWRAVPRKVTQGVRGVSERGVIQCATAGDRAFGGRRLSPVAPAYRVWHPKGFSEGFRSNRVDPWTCVGPHAVV